MKLSTITLCLLIAGCVCPQMQDGDRKHRAVIYDDKGNIREHVIIKDGYITIYARDWKAAGYGTVKP